MSDPGWCTFAVMNRIRSFCIENPTNNGNAAVIAMLLKEFHLTITKNQIAGAISRMGLLRGGFRKPVLRGPEEVAWASPRLPEMLTQHSRSRENGILGGFAKTELSKVFGLSAAGMKQCTRCGEWKHAIEFSKNEGRLRSDCRKCRSVVETAARAAAPRAPLTTRIQAIMKKPVEPKPPPAPLFAPAMPFVPSVGKCMFPMWKDQERPTHRYCDAPIHARSYCFDHARICYVATRPFKDAA